MGELCTRATNQLLEEGESRAQDQVCKTFTFLLFCFCFEQVRKPQIFALLLLLLPLLKSSLATLTLMLLFMSRLAKLFLFLDHHHAAGVDLDDAQVQELQDQLVDLVDQRCSELVEEADDACLGVLDQIQERFGENHLGSSTSS